MIARASAILAATLMSAAVSRGAETFAGYESVVAETHKASIEMREKVLRDTVADDTYWIRGNWGETIWGLAALYLNEKTDIANQQLLENANGFLEAVKDFGQ